MLVEEAIATIQSCRHKKDLPSATRLHAFLRRHRLDCHPVLGNHLVPLLVECGSLADAQQAFDRLPHPNDHSWTSLISGYLDSGDIQQAFHLYHKMRHDTSAQPNTCTYLALLGSIARRKDADRGCELCSDITKRGWERELYLGSSLVDVFSKCGWHAEARLQFDCLPSRSVITWNALIAGYAELELSDEAFDSIRQMQKEGLSPNPVTVLLCMKACSTKGRLEECYKLHSEAVKLGFEGELYVGSALVDMYVKGSLLTEAHQVFCGLPSQTVVTYNVLIAGFTEHGHAEEAVSFYKQMQHGGIAPDCVTFVCSLKACGNLGMLDRGREIHNEIIKRGLENELLLGNSLLDMYTKTGSLGEAHDVFDHWPNQDVISWNSLISGYADHGFADEVGACFQQMLLQGISPDSFTFVCSLRVCGTKKALDVGQKMHAEITKRGLEMHPYVGNGLVDMYTRCDLLPEAHASLDTMPVKDVVSWNALIGGYAKHGFDEEVLTCFKQMQLEGVVVDLVTIVLCLKACGSLGALETGQEIHEEARKSGLERDPFVGSILIDMYGKCGSVEGGQEVFDKLPIQDVVSWTALIKAYGENHEAGMAVQCFAGMQEQGVKPDTITFTCLLAACSHANLVHKGQEIFKMMHKDHGIEPTLDHYGCMVDLFARSGEMLEAEKLVMAIQSPPSRSILMALLSGCKIYGNVELGERCVQQLVELEEEDAAGYLLLAEIYASVGRWGDANKLGDVRKCARAKKKPGSASIEVNHLLHEFVVGVNQKEETIEMLEVLNACIKDEGYVPSLELVSGLVFDKVKETLTNFVDQHNFPLISDKGNIVLENSSSSCSSSNITL